MKKVIRSVVAKIVTWADKTCCKTYGDKASLSSGPCQRCVGRQVVGLSACDSSQESNKLLDSVGLIMALLLLGGGLVWGEEEQEIFNENAIPVLEIVDVEPEAVVQSYVPVSADDAFHVSAGPDGNGGVEVRAGVDVLSFTTAEGRRRREARRAETRERRANMTYPERIEDHFKHNWGKYAAGAAVIAVDRAAHNNGWLWYDWFGLASSSGGDNSGTQSGVNVNVDVSGDNNNVVIQIPHGSGEGMTGSSGNAETTTTTTTGF